MFKLVKMLNGKHCAPEIVEVKILSAFDYKAGAMYFFETGALVKEFNEKDDKKFIAIESLPKNSGKETIKGFFVNENMVFEADVKECPEELTITVPCDCYYDEKNHCVGIIGTAGMFGCVLNTDDAMTKGKALIYFKE